MRNPSSICYVFLLVASLLLPKSNKAVSQSSAPNETHIRFSVRTIEANNTLDPADESIQYTVQSKRGEATKVTVSVDRKLEDIRDKLLQLPFSHFHLVSARDEIMLIKEKNSLELPNGQILFFRPMYVKGEKIGLWLNWKDNTGRELLNTRLHFNPLDSVITGTDCGRNEGVVLAIKATQIY
jgi:hypothetical protein